MKFFSPFYVAGAIVWIALVAMLGAFCAVTDLHRLEAWCKSQLDDL